MPAANAASVPGCTGTQRQALEAAFEQRRQILERRAGLGEQAIDILGGACGHAGSFLIR